MWATNQDSLLSRETAKDIKLYHPDQEVIIISDSSFTANNWECKVIETNSPKWLQMGDDFLHTRYKILLENSDADLFIKVDPDSRIRGRITPPESPWFGQVYNDNSGDSTWGCGMGLRRDTIKKLLSVSPHKTDFRYKSVTGEILLSEDSTLGYYLSQILKITPSPWDDVRLGRIFNPVYLSEEWPITHPSLGKKIGPHLFRRIGIAHKAPQDAMSALVEQMESSGHQGTIHPLDGEIPRQFQINTWKAVIKNNALIGHPRQGIQSIALKEDGLLYHNEIVFCDPKKQNVIESWYLGKTLKIREALIKDCYGYQNN